MKKVLKRILESIGLIRKKGKTIFEIWDEHSDVAFIRMDFFPNGTGIVEIHSNHDEKYKCRLKNFLEEFKK